MRWSSLGVVLVSLSGAVGCATVTVQPKVPKSAPLAPAAGYVGGLFTKDTVAGFGFGLRDDRSQREYVLAVDEKDVGLIAVPPGTYRVAYWVTWAALTSERLTRKEIPAEIPLGRSFQVGPGQVMLLGKWAADREMGFGRNTFTIVPKRISRAEAVVAFRSSYPGFAEAPTSCLLCTK
jgi:hypothetical protein